MYPDYVLRDNPVAYWRLGERTGTTARDASGNGRDGTYHGGVSLGQAGALPGSVDAAARFDGTDDRVTIDWVFAPRTNSYSIEAWFKTSDSIPSGERVIFGSNWAASTAYQIRVRNSGGIRVEHLAVLSDNGSVNWYYASVNDDRWHHLVGVIDVVAGENRIYLDGALVATVAHTTVDLNPTIGSSIGAIRGWGADDYSLFFSGLIDEVALYDYALSAARISAHYEAASAGNYSATVLADNPVAYWRLNEQSGGTANDSSGNGRHGTYSGVVLNQPGAVVNADTAALFDGVDDAVSVPHNAAFNFTATQDFSVEFWLRGSWTKSGTLVEKWSNEAAGYPFAIRCSATGIVGARRYDGTNNPVVSSPTALNDDRWHHVAFVKQSSNLYLYVDGQRVASGTDTTTGDTTNTSNVYFGKRGNNIEFYVGLLDEVAIYNYALSAAQVKQHYDEGINPTHRPVLRVEIAFSSNPLATPAYTDVTQYVMEFRSRRGRQRELDRVEAGTALLVLDNRDRRFDPTNTSSPYYPNVVPMRRVRVSAIWQGTFYRLFTGFIESWPQKWPSFGAAVAEVQCVDLFKAFALRKISITAPQELSGARINRVLDHIGWPAGERSVDTGQSEVQAETMDETVLYQLQAVADAENGMLFIAGDGKVVFRNRHARIVPSSTPAPVFGDGSGELPYVELSIDYTDDQLWNHVIVQKAGGGTSGIAENNDSQTKYLKRTLERREVIITTDAEAQAAAEYLVYRYSEPQLVLRGMTLSPHASDQLWDETLKRELGDRVVVRRRPPGGGSAIEQASFVEGIQWDVKVNNWRTTWLLSPADKETFWMVAGADDDQYAPYAKLEQTTRVAY